MRGRSMSGGGGRLWSLSGHDPGVVFHDFSLSGGFRSR